jgi:hypothetical protein
MENKYAFTVIGTVVLAVLASTTVYYYLPDGFSGKASEKTALELINQHLAPSENSYSQDELRAIANNWILNNSSTYKFDGENLSFIGIIGNNFEYSFKSTHLGYGDRSGLILAQAITSHKIIIIVENGKVIGAITDGKYNELTKKLIY